jgi:hypothetical protein
MLLTACDAQYLLAEGEGLIRSCARSAPEQRFYLFLVNGETVTDSRLHGWHPNLIIERVSRPYDAQNWHGQMCCARAAPLARVLAEYGEPTIYLDADMLVRSSLKPLLAELAQCDLMVLHRPERVQIGAAGTPYGSSFNNAVIAVSPTEAGRKFAQAYANRLRDYMASGQPIEAYRPEYGLHFYVDQELLYVTYLDHRRQVRFRPLPQQFHNTSLKASATIWHGKGDVRRQPAYVREKLRFTRPHLYYPYSVYYQLYRVHQWLRAQRQPAKAAANPYQTSIHK